MWTTFPSTSVFPPDSFEPVIPMCECDSEHDHDGHDRDSVVSPTPNRQLNTSFPLNDPATALKQHTYTSIPPKPCADTWQKCDSRDAALNAIASKRRRNTLAARKTRQRKADYLRTLEERVQVLQAESTMWRERALMARELLRGSGLDFSFDEL